MYVPSIKGLNMLLSDVKSSFERKIKTAGGLSMPKDDELGDLFYEALLFVASKCIPRELLRVVAVDTDEEVYRLIGGGNFIIKPKRPVFNILDSNYSELEHLQIDSDLDFAVINKAAALQSRDAVNIAKFETESNRVINRYKANFQKAGQ